MKETIFTLNNKDDNTSIGDVVYLPEKWMTNARLGQFGAWLRTQDWFRKIAKKVFSKEGGIDLVDPANLATLAFMLLKQEQEFSVRGWSSETAHEPEADWVKLLPRDARRQLWKNWAISGGVEPLGIAAAFPFMGFGYIIKNDADDAFYSMANEAACVFKLHRLHEVRQLAFMKDPVGFEDDRSIMTLPYGHTRYLHSLDVLAVGTLLANNSNLSPEDARTLQVACEVHDALTPAGGDSTKLIDRKLFDEDLQFPRLLQGERWLNFSQQYGINGDLLTETVRGHGVLGQLLNVADKTSYIARDAFAYIGGRKPDPDQKFAGGGYYMVADLLERHPTIAALWEVTKVIKGRVVITDPDRLGLLLTLRALLFKHLYYNPYSRFFEYLLGKGVTKILFRRGEITYDELLHHGDHWLLNKVDEFLGVQYATYNLHNFENARIEEVHGYGAACKRAAEFDNDPNTIVVIDDFEHVSNSAVHNWWVKAGREVKTFAESRPHMAERIEKIMTFPTIKRLYFFIASDLHIPRSSQKRVKDAFLELRKELEAKISTA